MTTNQPNVSEPSLWGWVVKVGSLVGITGILCCVAPMVLFMLGLAGGVWAISFADFFYEGTGHVGAWVLRGVATLIAVGGLLYFRRKQNQCSIDPARKRKNFILATLAILLLGTGLLLTLDKLSGWYFANHIVPAQQAEIEAKYGS